MMWCRSVHGIDSCIDEICVFAQTPGSFYPITVTAMGSPNDIKKSAVILLNNDPWVVTEFQHINPGKGAAFVRTRIKNLKSGKTLEQTFKVSESVDFVNVEYTTMQYLYKDATGYTFMDTASYEQHTMDEDAVGDQGKFLREGLDVMLTMYEGRPIAIQLPKKMNFKVVETMPAVAGNTASGNVTKDAKTDNGFMIRVPLFIKEGEEVVVNTETGEYVERA
jgi:elongation factor P